MSNHGPEVEAPQLHSIYLAPTGDEFNQFYGRIVEGLLRLLFDDPKLQQNPPLTLLHRTSTAAAATSTAAAAAGIDSTEQRMGCSYLPKAGKVLSNVNACELLVSLLNSSHLSLVMVALRACFGAMRVNPSSLIAFESTGVVTALVNTLLAVIFTGTLSCSDSSQNNNNHSSAVPTSAEMCSFVSDAVLVLQMMAVAAADRDYSILSLLALLLLYLNPPDTVTTTAYTSGSNRNSTSSSSNNLNSVSVDGVGIQQQSPSAALSYVDLENGRTALMTRCQNCEMECAKFHCLNDSCLHDQCSKLCHECDKVFHKSATKRQHIRIPIMCIHLVDQSAPSTPAGHSPRMRNSSRDRLSQLQQQQQHYQYSAWGNMDSDDIAATTAGTVPTVKGVIDSMLSCGPASSMCYQLLVKSISAPLQQCIAQYHLDDELRSICEVQVDCSLKDAFQCVILAAVRGLLDDRRARSSALMPACVLPGLLLLLRNAVCDAPLLRKDEEQSKLLSIAAQLPDLVNYREDLLTAVDDPLRKTSHYANYMQPPEIHTESPRRIKASLLVQCIARFFIPPVAGAAAPSAAAAADGLDQRNPRATDAPASSILQQQQQCTCSASEINAQEVQCSLQLMQMFAVDAIFIHLLLDVSTYSLTTAVDRQYLLWLLRECAISALVTDTALNTASKFIGWLMWLIKGAVPENERSLHNARSLTGLRPQLPSQQQQQQQQWGNRKGSKFAPGAIRGSSSSNGSNNSSSSNTELSEKLSLQLSAVRSAIVATDEQQRFLLPGEVPLPSQQPVITLPLRFMAMQEVRLLLEVVGGEFPCNNRSFAQDSRWWRQSALSSIPISLKKSSYSNSGGGGGNSNSGGMSATSSRESLYSRSNASTSDSSAGISKSRVSVLHSCLLISNRSLKSILISLGFIPLLLHLVVGDLRTRVVSDIMNAASITASSNCSCSSSSSARSNDASGHSSRDATAATSAINRRQQQQQLQTSTLSELEREDWWLSLATLSQLLNGSDEAKVELQRSFGVQRLVKVFLNLIDSMDSCSLDNDSLLLQKYRSIIASFIVELCVMNGALSTPNSVFTTAVSRAPHILQQVVGNRNPTAAAAATETASVADNASCSSSASASSSAAKELFSNRLLFEDEHADDNNSSGDSGCNVMNTARLSPIYYVQNRSVVLINSTLNPSFLEWSNASFARVFESVIPLDQQVQQQLSSSTAGKVAGGSTRNSETAIAVAAADRRSFRGISGAAATDASGDANSVLSKRLLLSRNISTASLASHSESDANRWDVESIGLNSSAHGERDNRDNRELNSSAARGSVSSYHSLLALSQALGSHTPTPTPSLHGDSSATSGGAMDRSSDRTARGFHNSFHSIKSSFGVYTAAAGSAAATTAAVAAADGVSSRIGTGGGERQWVHTPGSLLTSLPFPPMLSNGPQLDTNFPLVYFPLLQLLNTGQSEHYATLLVLLNHALLIRAGYSDQFFPSCDRSGSQEEQQRQQQLSSDSAELAGRQSVDPTSSQQQQQQRFSSDVNTPQKVREARPEKPLEYSNSQRIETAAAVKTATVAEEERPSAIDMPDCRIVLRKHLSLLLPPKAWAQSQLQQQLSTLKSGSSECFPSIPPYSKLQIRSPECAELLLSACLLSREDVQLFLLSVLSNLVEGNPANAFCFLKQPSTCQALCALVQSLKEGLQEAVGYFISQILRYSIQLPALKQLIIAALPRLATATTSATATTTTIAATSSIARESADRINKNALFMLGRAAERPSPTNFLHFDLSAPLASSVELPPITQIVDYTTAASATASSSASAAAATGATAAVGGAGITVCAWLRLGALSGGAPTAALFQLHDRTRSTIVDVYFRTIHKLTAPAAAQSFNHHGSDTSSVASSSSMHGGGNDNNGGENVTSRRVVQLCIACSSSSCITTQKIETAVATTASAATAAAAHWRMALAQAIGNDAVDHNSHKNVDSSNINSNSNNNMSSDLMTDTSTIAAAINRFSIPDVIVEFDWTEMGSWHLLALTISNSNRSSNSNSSSSSSRSSNSNSSSNTNSNNSSSGSNSSNSSCSNSFSSSNIACSIDGKSCPLLHWTPLGYQYDAFSRSLLFQSAMRSKKASAFNFDFQLQQQQQWFVGLMDQRVAGSSFAGLLSGISKTNACIVSVGGLSAERVAYNQLVQRCLTPLAPCSYPPHQQQKQKQEDGAFNSSSSNNSGGSDCFNAVALRQLLELFDTVIGGFGGAVGEVLVLPAAAVSMKSLATAFKRGPTNHLSPSFAGALVLSSLHKSGLTTATSQSGNSTSLALKLNGVAAVTTAATDASTAGAAAMPASTSLGFASFRSPSSSTAAAAAVVDSIQHQSTPVVFSSNVLPLLKERLPAAASFWESAKDNSSSSSEHQQQQLMRFGSRVQLHRTSALFDALHCVGGLKALYPLLAADATHFTAALRIISAVISASEENYREFSASGTDKVIFYCACDCSQLITSETIQVMFDMCVKQQLEYAEHSTTVNAATTAAATAATTAVAPERILNGGGVVLESHDYIDRVDALTMLFHTALATAPATTTTTTTTTAAATTIAATAPRSWSIARSCIDWLREMCDDELHNARKFLSTVGLLPLLVLLSTCEVGDIQSLQHITRRGSSSNRSSNSNSNCSNESALTAPTAASAGAVFESMTSSAATGATAVATEVVAAFREELQRRESDCRRFAEKSRLQQSCCKCLRVLITGTSGEGRQQDAQCGAASRSSTGSDFCGTHVRLLLSFAVLCAKSLEDLFHCADEAATAAAAARRREFWKIRGSRQLQNHNSSNSSSSGLPSLRQRDYCESGYWLMSGALIALDCFIDLLSSVFEAHIITMVKQSFSASSLFSLILFLMNSRCVELHERALKLLLITFSGVGGELDQKQVTAFDRMNGFRLMADSLGNCSDSCCESVINAIFRILFWQRRKRPQPVMAATTATTSQLAAAVAAADQLNDDADESFEIDFAAEVAAADGEDTTSKQNLHLHSIDAVATTAIDTNEAATVTKATTAPSTVTTAVATSTTAATASTAVDKYSSSQQPSTAAAGTGLMSFFTWGSSQNQQQQQQQQLKSRNNAMNEPMRISEEGDSVLLLVDDAVAATAAIETAEATKDSHVASIESLPSPTAAAAVTTAGAIAITATTTITATTGGAAAAAAVNAPVVEQQRQESSHYNSGDIAAAAAPSAFDSPFEMIAVPQMIEALFRVLRNSKSSDLISDSFAKLTRSILPLRENDWQSLKHQQQHFFRALGGAAPALSSSSSSSGTFAFAMSSQKAAQNTLREKCEHSHLLAVHNCESIFSQRDWLMWLCDLMLQLHRQLVDADEAALDNANTSLLSLSENEYAGPYYGNMRTTTAAAAASSSWLQQEQQQDDAASASVANESADDGTSDGGGNYFSSSGSHFHPHFSSNESTGNQSSTSSSQQQQGALFDRFVQPVLTFVRRALILDMTAAKASAANRRWNEIFRLSTPETNDIQEAVILDLLDALPLLSAAAGSDYCDGSVNSVLNILRNIAAMLEQAHEKTSVSLYFSVKVVQSLHSLSYHCAPEVRSRLKETLLPDVRRNYVVRCLLDNSQEFYAKVAALSEIALPLQDYLSTADNKPLADTHVVVLILAMLVEACEDLEFVMGGMDADNNNSSSSSNAGGGGVKRSDQFFGATTTAATAAGGSSSSASSGVDRGRAAGSPVVSSAFDRFQISFEIVEVLVCTVQHCNSASQHCRKFVQRLLQELPGDAHGIVANALLHAFALSDDVQRSADAGGAAIELLQRSNSYPTASTAASTVTATTAGAAVAVGGGKAESSRWFNGWTATAAGDSVMQTLPGQIDAEWTEEAAVTTTTAAYTTTTAATAVAVENLRSVDSEQQQRKQQLLPQHAPIPSNLRAFIDWFSAGNQRELQNEFRNRVLKEQKSTQRVLDKLRERVTNRFTRFTRLTQERRTKETAAQQRIVKDASALKQQHAEKISSKLQKDLKVLKATLSDSFEAGRALFTSSEQEVSKLLGLHPRNGNSSGSSSNSSSSAVGKEKGTTSTAAAAAATGSNSNSSNSGLPAGFQHEPSDLVKLVLRNCNAFDAMTNETISSSKSNSNISSNNNHSSNNNDSSTTSSTTSTNSRDQMVNPVVSKAEQLDLLVHYFASAQVAIAESK